MPPHCFSRAAGLRRLQEALAAFARLPPAQYNTGWVLCQVGRAHAEAVDYASAERAFLAARQVCPHQLEGMEHFSTVLWHLKRDAALAHLAHEAVALDRLSPAAWCVMGNCLSAQREHEAALRAFNRAIALDRDCTYAYTLAGHEHFAAEDWDAAMNDYRVALGVDPRHYNAWYGLGAVLMRQEKYELADYHFRRALDIHPRSSVLHCCLGQALHALGRAPEALRALDAAVLADACNPLARYERAAVLVTMERLQEALAALLALKEVAPREASVYLLMAKVYRRLNQPGLAALCAGTGADMGGAAELGGKDEEESVHEV
jgi:anaphase-promoting complex subunit 3